MAIPKSQFRLEGFFGFRTPLLPYNEWSDWNAELGSAIDHADPEQFCRAYEHDRRILRERLKVLLTRPEILESLQVASPDLVASLPRWLQAPDSDKGQRSEMALVRYFARMCHRPTPFGLFAGHAMGRKGTTTRLEVAPLAACRRRSRLDMGFLCDLVAEVQKDPGLREELVYRPNNSLYQIGNRLRFAQVQRHTGQRHFELVGVQPDEPLETVLAQAQDGARMRVLAQTLVADGFSQEEAQIYLHELINRQILVPDLEPPTTGPEPLHELIRTLAGASATAPIAKALTKAACVLEGIDAKGFGNTQEAYQGLARTLQGLPVKVENQKLFQVDLFRPGPRVTLGPSFQEDMVRAMDLLFKLTPNASEDSFQAFREAFRKRYEDRWLPLAEALDPECGIGFQGAYRTTAMMTAPLLDGLALGSDGNPEGLHGLILRPREAHLLKRVMALQSQGGQTLELTGGDLLALQDNRIGLPPPASFSCQVELAAVSPQALEAGHYQVFLAGGGGPSAMRMLGRFCHGDPELSAQVERHLRAEEELRPQAIFAEIAHLPHERTGNVLARPVLRTYEIPYLGRSGAKPSQWLALEDLYVGLAGDRVVLWSRRLGQEIIPRLSSAATYLHHVTDVYRFLASLQDQGVQSSMGFTWGLLASEPTLPRVVHGNLVLAKAQWRLNATELKSIGKARDARGRFLALLALRTTRAMPRHMLLAEGDHELPLDMDNPLSAEAFWGAIKGRESVLLLEDFPGRDQLVATGPEGAFTHQLVLAFIGEPGAKAASFVPPHLNEARVRHAPGSEWLFAKLYTGQHTADQLLGGPLAHLVKEAMASGDADRWFFIRYADPEPHLRIRFHGDPSRIWARVLPRLNQTLGPLLENTLLWQIQLDTYDPETRRFGGLSNLARAEKIFMADSEAAMEILATHPGDEGGKCRWHLALASVDGYFASADLPLEARYQLAKARFAGFSKEYGLHAPAARHKLAARFRLERQKLETLLDPNQPDENPLARGMAILGRRSRRLRPWFVEMRALEKAEGLTVGFEELLGSFIHMSVNRMLQSSQRAQEMVIYYFLMRLYESRLAKSCEAGRIATPAQSL